MRPEEKRGLTDEQINATGAEMKEVPGADPLGLREGKEQAPNSSVAETMNKCADEVEKLVSAELAKRRNCIDVDKVKEAIQNVKGAVMMGYPMGLPEWDTVRMNLEGVEDLSGQEESKWVLESESCSLWFAGKQMMRDEVLQKYIGKNEKCIVQAKFTKKGSGAPQRPPAVDEDTQKKMMAYWHKKQAEQKDLEEDDEDQYLNSAWANPKAFKTQMHGLGGIRFR